MSRMLGLVAVNIHTKGRIPWLNLMGPRYNITISNAIYQLLAADPRVEIYRVDMDPKLKPGQVPTQATSQAAPTPKESTIKVEDTVKIEKVEEKKVEPIKEEVKVEQVLPTPKPLVDDNIVISTSVDPDKKEEEVKIQMDPIDEEIETKLAELPEEPELEFKIPEEEKDGTLMVTYKKEDLEPMTKAQLKRILNVERGFEPGHQYYGSHHDGKEALISYVLESQKYA
jgi:hypothetical protein